MTRVKEFLNMSGNNNPIEDLRISLEALLEIEIGKLSYYIGKRKDSKTRVSKSIYDKKIDKARRKSLKILEQLNKLEKVK